MLSNDNVPKYFAIHCAQARQGGANGYETAAYHLAIHVYTEHPLTGTWAEWQDECARLRDLCGAGDDEGVWDWFRAHFPRCMELVPARRKGQFLKGVYQAYQEERIA
jgi:hypothetical protein